ESQLSPTGDSVLLGVRTDVDHPRISDVWLHAVIAHGGWPQSPAAARMTVAVVSPSGRVAYRDSSDHFETALLRLMNLDHEAFHRWLELAEESDAAELLDRLRDGWVQLRPAPSPAVSAGPLAPGPGGLTGRVWHAAIAESPSHGVAVSDDAAHG